MNGCIFGYWLRIRVGRMLSIASQAGFPVLRHVDPLRRAWYESHVR